MEKGVFIIHRLTSQSDNDNDKLLFASDGSDRSDESDLSDC